MAGESISFVLMWVIRLFSNGDFEYSDNKMFYYLVLFEMFLFIDDGFIMP